MSIIINTNMSALIAMDCMNISTQKMNTSMQRLSTGLRINSAKDDPAGSFYAGRLNTELRGIQVAYQNTAAAINMVSTAEDDLTIINDHLERIKDLATQYANDSMSDAERVATKEEVQQRVDEINRIAKESDFNGVKLLDGSSEGARFQIGGGSDAASNSITCTGVFQKATTGSDGLGLFGGTFTDVNAAFADSTTASQFIDIVKTATEEVSKRISTAGIYENRLISVSNLLMARNENLTSAYSSVMDTDISTETANYIKYQILQQTASSMLVQANQAPGAIALKLIDS